MTPDQARAGSPVASTRLVTVALANKMARIAWAVMARGETYRSSPAPAPAAAVPV